MRLYIYYVLIVQMLSFHIPMYLILKSKVSLSYIITIEIGGGILIFTVAFILSLGFNFFLMLIMRNEYFSLSKRNSNKKNLIDESYILNATVISKEQIFFSKVFKMMILFSFMLSVVSLVSLFGNVSK